MPARRKPSQYTRKYPKDFLATMRRAGSIPGPISAIRISFDHSSYYWAPLDSRDGPQSDYFYGGGSDLPATLQTTKTGPNLDDSGLDPLRRARSIPATSQSAAWHDN